MLFVHQWLFDKCRLSLLPKERVGVNFLTHYWDWLSLIVLLYCVEHLDDALVVVVVVIFHHLLETEVFHLALLLQRCSRLLESVSALLHLFQHLLPQVALDQPKLRTICRNMPLFMTYVAGHPQQAQVLLLRSAIISRIELPLDLLKKLHLAGVFLSGRKEIFQHQSEHLGESF